MSNAPNLQSHTHKNIHTHIDLDSSIGQGFWLHQLNWPTSHWQGLVAHLNWLSLRHTWNPIGQWLSGLPWTPLVLSGEFWDKRLLGLFLTSASSIQSSPSIPCQLLGPECFHTHYIFLFLLLFPMAPRRMKVLVLPGFRPPRHLSKAIYYTVISLLQEMPKMYPKEAESWR